MYQLHARSYIKNSQLTFARRLSDRNDRLTAEYLNPGNGQATPKAPAAATQVGKLDHLDLYVGFLYNTTVKTAPSPDRASATGDQASDSATKKPVWQGINERVLSFLEDSLSVLLGGLGGVAGAAARRRRRQHLGIAWDCGY